MSALRNRWNIAFGCLLILVCATARAAAVCEKQALSAGENLSRYLLEYARACVDEEAKRIESGWKIKPGAPNAFQVIPAWTGIAERFAALPRVSASQLSLAYDKLAKRAEHATAAFKADAKENTGVGAAFYGNVAWKLPPSLGGQFPPDPNELYFPGLPDGQGTINIAEAADADCRDAASMLCREALAGGKALMLAWRLAHDLSDQLGVAAVSKIGEQVAVKRALWNRYLYQSKPMLPLDHIATDFFDGRWKDSDQYPDGVREPPNTQYFLFHPSVAVEQLSSAPDGEQFKPVLVLEVFGANRWREDRRWINAPLLRTLSGASIAFTYADRAGVRDIGKGVVVTFENVYSIGVMHYDSRTGVLFSIDLANAWREKYKDKYESFRNGLKNTPF